MAEQDENEVIEEEEEECPKCPPVGAPAWMATFADMATLLMAFFVLILSFAEFNVPKFKQISGSLKNAFGVQKVVPIVEQPKGTTVLSLNFSPSPAKSVTDEMTQQTTETTKPDLESQTKTKDSDGSGEKQSDAEDLVKALQEAVARGDIQVETLGDNVVVNFTPTEAEQKDLPQLLQQTLNAIEKAKAATGKSEQDVLFGGIEGQLAELAAAASAAAKSTKEQAEAKAESNKKAQIAEDELKVALRQEIGQGLAGWIAEKQTVVNANDLSNEARFDVNVDAAFSDMANPMGDPRNDFVAMNALGVPIKNHDGSLLGVCVMLNKCNCTITRAHATNAINKRCVKASVAKNVS